MSYAVEDQAEVRRTREQLMHDLYLPSGVRIKADQPLTSEDFLPPEFYVQQFELPLVKRKQRITFTYNANLAVHRWSPYVQGFSADFVDGIFTKYRVHQGGIVLDPFAGCGTVNVCAKMRGINSIGVELNPLLSFILRVKTDWDLDVQQILYEVDHLPLQEEPDIAAPEFLRSTDHFEEKVLKKLLILKSAILEVRSHKIRHLFRMAFASILTDCSNLKRSPCLGYDKNKKVSDDAPFLLFRRKINEILEDLAHVQQLPIETFGNVKVIEDDARTMLYEPESVDIAITSPPYVNGIDYVINYKIELAWLDFVESQADLRKLKDSMVVCDNVSRRLIRQFGEREDAYSNEWLEDIVERIREKIQERGSYRRKDMPWVVKKYFDDLYPMMKNVYSGLKVGGRFVLVVGDSLMAGVYIPADLLLARMGKEAGFEIEGVQIARERRSGQVRSFKLRESVVTLWKN